jgi:beta-lactam-binding protein with PASTA domain
VIAAFGTGGVDLSTATTYGEQQPITLVVSAGALPNVVGLSVADATQRLKDVGVTATSGRDTYSDTIPAGRVIGIELATGQVVRPGSSVSLTLSKGKEQVAVPVVLNMAWPDAKAALQSAGFSIKFKNLASQAVAGFNTGTVTSISPDQGTLVDKGSTVIVNLNNL